MARRSAGSGDRVGCNGATVPPLPSTTPWLDPEPYGLVLERAYLNLERQAVTFLGARELIDEAGNVLRADPPRRCSMSSTRSVAR